MTARNVKDVSVRISRLDHALDLDLPAYQSEGAAGLDLVAAIDGGAPVVLAPGSRAGIATGIAIALPQGYEAQVRPRSGLALRSGVTVLNAPGTVDADYRGEIVAILINHGEVPHEIRRGDRVAQLVIQEVVHAQLVEVDVLDDTERGAQGFGSTGR